MPLGTSGRENKNLLGSGAQAAFLPLQPHFGKRKPAHGENRKAAEKRVSAGKRRKAKPRVATTVRSPAVSPQKEPNVDQASKLPGAAASDLILTSA